MNMATRQYASFKVNLEDDLILMGLRPPALKGVTFVEPGKDAEGQPLRHSVRPPVQSKVRRPLTLPPASLAIYAFLLAFVVGLGACGSRSLTRAMESAILYDSNG